MIYYGVPYTYLVWFDNLVTDDRIIIPITATSIEECDEIAYKMSQQSGFSEGNYRIFKEEGYDD